MADEAKVEKGAGRSRVWGLTADEARLARWALPHLDGYLENLTGLGEQRCMECGNDEPCDCGNFHADFPAFTAEVEEGQGGRFELVLGREGMIWEYLAGAILEDDFPKLTQKAWEDDDGEGALPPGEVAESLRGKILEAREGRRLLESAQRAHAALEDLSGRRGRLNGDMQDALDAVMATWRVFSTMYFG